jgi:peptide/nickel transport system permease protein
VFSRTIYGARRSLLISTVSAAIGLLVGGTLGLVSGFYRRGIDATISAIVTILLSIPGLVLVLALMAAFAPPDKSSTTKQTFWAIVALSILMIPALARVTRGQTTVWSERDFVMASRTLGARNKRMMFRDVLPNMIPTMFSFAFLMLATLIVLEAALAFFGVSGVSWGVMIENGRRQLLYAPHMVLFPALFMFITILALNLIGDSIRTRFDVRESGI